MKTYFALAACLVSVAVSGLEALEEEYMAGVHGQAGITIQTLTENTDGTVLTVGNVRYNEADKNSDGSEFVDLSDIRIQMVSLDPNTGAVTGPGAFNTTIDVTAAGELLIRTTELEAFNLNVGSIGFSGRSIGALGLNRWRFAEDSYIEAAFVPGSDRAKIRSRVFMTDGSGIDFRYLEDDLVLSSDIKFRPDSSNQDFLTEFFISADDNALRVDLGETRGTLEINNLRLSDAGADPFSDDDDTNLFDDSFGDIGFGDITVTEGYFTLAANPDAEGIVGKFLSDLTVGRAFYRTNGNQVALKDLSLTTNGEAIDYSFELVGGENDFGRGLSLVFTNISDLDLRIGSIVFADDNNIETPSLGSIAIENLSLNGGEIVTSVWALSGAGSQGVRLDNYISECVSFDFVFREEVTSTAAISANVVMGELSSETFVDITKEGLHLTVENFEASAYVDSIRLGRSAIDPSTATYAGQTGRLGFDGVTVSPGSYLRVEPIPNI